MKKKVISRNIYFFNCAIQFKMIVKKKKIITMKKQNQNTKAKFLSALTTTRKCFRDLVISSEKLRTVHLHLHVRHSWHLKMYVFKLVFFFLSSPPLQSLLSVALSVGDVYVSQSAGQLAELIAALSAASVMQNQCGLSNELSRAMIHHQWDLAAPPLIRHDTPLYG